MKSIDEIKGIFEQDVRFEVDSDAISFVCNMLQGFLIDIDEHLSVEKYDVENVHQLRVCLRTVKTLLNSKPYIFEFADTEAILTSLDNLFDVASEVRNIDTLILSYDTYLSEVPASFKADSKNVLKSLNYKNAQAKRAFTKYAKSSSVSDLFDQSLEFIKKYNETSSSYFVGDLANDRVFEAFNNIRAFLEEETELNEERINSLRLLCKKLHYNLDLFGEFVEIKKYKKTVDKLQATLSDLGLFNDLCTHIKILTPMAEKSPIFEVALIASIVTIIEALKNELFDVIEYDYENLSKKDKLFGVKKKTLKKY